jgi:regulator of protease activity HflC (stomatin/prohibitin superfamily)
MPVQRIDLEEVKNKLPSFRIIKLIIILVLAIVLIKKSIVIIPAGYVGVIYDNGRGVLPNTFNEGMNFIIPFWQYVAYFDTRIQEYTMSIIPDEGALMRDDSLDAPTSDGQQVKVDASVIFRIDRDKAPEIWKTIGWDYVDKLIRPFSRSQIRMVISRYTAPAIYSEKRQEAEQVITDELSEMLKSKNIIIDKVLLRNVSFSPEYSKAIEQKVIAEQKVKQAEFEVKEATQRAQAKIAEAKGLAEAQLLQKQTLTQEFLQLEAIKKWDGKMPQVAGSGNAPFINIPLK